MKLWPYTWHDDKPEEFERPQRAIDKTMDHVDEIIREQKDRIDKQRWLILKWWDRANVASAYHVPLIIDEVTWAEIVVAVGFPWNPYARQATFRGIQVLVPFDGGGKLE